jgi:hypothetical protein
MHDRSRPIWQTKGNQDDYFTTFDRLAIQFGANCVCHWHQWAGLGDKQSDVELLTSHMLLNLTAAAKIKSPAFPSSFVFLD